MAFCECGSGLNNLGVNSCFNTMKTIKKHIFVSLYDSDGNRNSIATSDLVDGKLTEDYVAGKLFNTDPSAKWYPTPNVYENVESTRTDPTTEDLQSGTTIRIQDGVQTFLGYLVQVDPTLAQRIQGNSCNDFGVYEVDLDGSIRGEKSGDGTELYPIKINKGSLNSSEVPMVEGTSVQKVMVSFQFDGTVSEINLIKIESSNIEFDMLKIASMIDGVLSETGGATQSETNLFVDFDTKFGGSFGSPIPVRGKTEITDWAVVDSSLGVVTISGVTENPDGSYDLTITGVTAPETLQVTYVVNSTDPLDTEVESNILTIALS